MPNAVKVDSPLNSFDFWPAVIGADTPEIVTIKDSIKYNVYSRFDGESAPIALKYSGNVVVGAIGLIGMFTTATAGVIYAFI